MRVRQKWCQHEASGILIQGVKGNTNWIWTSGNWPTLPLQRSPFRTLRMFGMITLAWTIGSTSCEVVLVLVLHRCTLLSSEKQSPHHSNHMRTFCKTQKFTSSWYHVDARQIPSTVRLFATAKASCFGLMATSSTTNLNHPLFADPTSHMIEHGTIKNNNSGDTDDQVSTARHPRTEVGDPESTPRSRKIRLEQNRKAAKESRRRKKLMIEGRLDGRWRLHLLLFAKYY